MPAAAPGAARAGLIGATVAVSASAIFIRLADSDATTIVWLRMTLAVLLLLPWVLNDLDTGHLRLDRRQRWLMLAAGGFLAIHFLSWTASLAYTTVASSVLLVSMHPVLVTPLAARLFDERLPRKGLIGIGLALLGTAVTCGGDLRVNATALRGDGLALLGAGGLTGYLLVGRKLSGLQGVATYSASAYSVVAAAALLLAVAGHHLIAPPPRTLLACAGLAVVCTIAGHTVFNWSLAAAGAASVSVAFLGEAPLAALLALLVLEEVPGPSTIVGGAIILAGIGLALTSAAAPAERVAELG